MSDLYVYTTPADATVSLRLDDGRQVQGGPPITANDRADAHLLPLPANTGRQGGVLTIGRPPEYQPFDNRGIVVEGEGEAPARFELDDVRLAPVPVAPTDPVPDPNADPLAIINAVWATGRYQLLTKPGCGVFTEACCTALHDQQSPMWGHVMKNPGQNQYNGHAVDAVMLLAAAGATESGIYDIIHDSESPDASPVFNYAGPADSDLWRYPASSARQATTALYDLFLPLVALLGHKEHR